MTHTERVRAVPSFPPVRPARVRCGLRRVVHRAARPLAATTALLALAAFAFPGGSAVGEEAAAAVGEPSETPPASAPHEDDPTRAGPRSPQEPHPGEPTQAPRSPGAADDGDRAETVFAPVRLSDPAVARLLEPGDLVDVLGVAAAAAPDGTAPEAAARRLAHRVEIAEIPPPVDAEHHDTPAGSLLVLEVSPSEAAVIAGATADSRLTVTRW